MSDNLTNIYGTGHSDYMALSRLPKSIWKLLASPTGTVTVCALSALFALPFSFHLSLMAISVSYVFIAYYVERKNIGALLIPPLAIFAIFNFVTGSLGPTLVAENVFSRNMDPVLITQIVSVATFPIFLWVYWFINRKTPPMRAYENGRLPALFSSGQFYFVAWSLVIFTAVQYYVEIYTGIVDRGYAGEIFLDTPYGIWSYFIAFSKFNYVAYLLIPYLYKASNRFVRLALVTLVSVYFLFQIANSTRGTLFTAPILMTLGYWLIGGSFKRVFFTLAVVAALIFVVTPILGDFRGSGALQATEMKDLGGRLGSLLESQKSESSFDEGWAGRVGNIIGRAFLGCNDPIIYEDTPGVHPFVGWEGFSGIVYMWFPSMFFPDKQSLMDGGKISTQYTGVFYERSNIGIRLPADLYRRFGWLGVFLGYPFYALTLSLFCRYAFRSFANKATAAWGFFIILFITALIHHCPSGTVLEIVWTFFYDYAKYLLVLWLLLWVGKYFGGSVDRRRSVGCRV